MRRPDRPDRDVRAARARLAAADRALPGDWIWPSLLLLLVAAGSATAGIVAGRDTETATAPATMVATSPVVTAPPLAAGSDRADDHGHRDRRRSRSRLPTPPEVESRPTWPARDGFTVVLASIPARGTGLAEATARRRRSARDARPHARRRARSRRFSSLHPGYYVGLRRHLRLRSRRRSRDGTGRYPSTRTHTRARSTSLTGTALADIRQLRSADFVTEARKGVDWPLEDAAGTLNSRVTKLFCD